MPVVKIEEGQHRAVVVMGKVPRPGRVKTRLVPALSAETACTIYEAFLADVFALVDRAARDLEFARVFACGLSSGDALADAQALVPAGWEVIVQEGKDLAERIVNARRAAGGRETVVIGSDSPTMPLARFTEAFAALESGTNVIGPTLDGGYYLIGLSDNGVALLESIPWSTNQVMEATRAVAKRQRIPLVELALGYDIDLVEDLPRAARDAVSGMALQTARVLTDLGFVFGNGPRGERGND